MRADFHHLTFKVLPLKDRQSLVPFGKFFLSNKIEGRVKQLKRNRQITRITRNIRGLKTASNCVENLETIELLRRHHERLKYPI
jgi:hypothetical protein